MTKTSNRWLICLGLFLLSVCGVEETRAAPVRLSLEQALARGFSQNMELKAESAKVEQAIADIDRVYGEFGPHIQGTAGLGPITKTTGNALHSQEDSSKWGAAFLGRLEFTQPIYAWNRKSDYLTAARHGKIVSEEDVRLKKNGLRYSIKESYYGTLYTLSLLDFIREGKKDIERVETDLGKKITKEDRFKLEILRSQIELKEAEVVKAYELARASLALRVGAKLEEEILPQEEWIEESERKIEPFEHYLAIARREKPEFRQLEAGIVAKKALASAEWKGQLPVLAVLAKYDFAKTAIRQDQQSVFAYDPYNQDIFVMGIGFKWDFQWGLQNAKASKYSAEALELEAKQAYATTGLAVLVKKAWLELNEAEAKMKSARAGSKAAKKWLANAMMGVSSGLGDVKKIVDAYQARALTLKDFYEAIFRHHMAWAELSQVVGIEVDPFVKETSVRSGP